MARDDVFDKIVIGAGPVGESVARPAVEGGPSRARYFALTQPQLGAHDDERLRLVNEVVAKDKVHSPTLELDEQLATRPRLFLGDTTMALLPRLLIWLNELTALRMALEGLSPADLADPG